MRSSAPSRRLRAAEGQIQALDPDRRLPSAVGGDQLPIDREVFVRRS
jgi:hypothetical protein